MYGAFVWVHRALNNQKRRFLARAGERFALLSAGEAEALELFGPAPMGARCRRHIGDFVAVAAALAIGPQSHSGVA